MIRNAKDLSPDQKLAIENLLGRPISEEEHISIRTVALPPAPEWLKGIQRDAEQNGVNALTMDEIDAEIEASRRARR